MNVTDLLLVAVGGAIGSIARYGVSVGSGRLFGPNWPLGTVFVNITGSFVMGLFVGLLALRYQGSPALRLFVAVGILGGYTTFSSFSLDSIALWERGETAAAAIYVLGSVLLSLAALFGGLTLARSFA